MVKNTHKLLLCRLPRLFIQTQAHPSLTKNTQYYCPSRTVGKEMMASTNINANQWLCEAKRHKRSSSPRTSSSTAPRICNYRRLKMFIGKSHFSIGDPSVKITQLCTSSRQGLCCLLLRVAYYGMYLNSCCQNCCKWSWQVSTGNDKK